MRSGFANSLQTTSNGVPHVFRISAIVDACVLSLVEERGTASYDRSSKRWLPTILQDYRPQSVNQRLLQGKIPTSFN